MYKLIERIVKMDDKALKKLAENYMKGSSEHARIMADVCKVEMELRK